jgi:hypothetical protein
MIKRIPILCIVMLTIVIISSCGPQITPCGCKNSNDSDYLNKCEKFLIGAPHDEYVRFKAEMDNCGKKAEMDSENVPTSDTDESLDEGLDNTSKENTSVSGLETEVNEMDQGFKREVTQENWTLEDKKQWVDNCITGVNATSLSDMKLSFKKEYCTCMFEKLTIKYPNKLDNVNSGIAKEFAKECFKESLK